MPKRKNKSAEPAQRTARRVFSNLQTAAEVRHEATRLNREINETERELRNCTA